MKVTYALILICIVVFGLQLFAPTIRIHNYDVDFVTGYFSLIPADAFAGNVWQFVTYMFLHGGFTHIAINMFVLLIFGVQLERVLGWKKFSFLYMISGIASGFLYIIFGYVFTPVTFAINDMVIPMLGASGAIFAVMAGYGVLFPKNWIIMFPGIPMPAGLAVIVFAGLEFFLGVTGLEGNVANFGHLGGLIFGVILVLYWKKKGQADKSVPGKDWEFVWE